MEELKLARTAFEIEVLQNGLCKKAISIVKLYALFNFDKAIELTKEYITSTQTEICNANEADEIAKELLLGNNSEDVFVLSNTPTS